MASAAASLHEKAKAVKPDQPTKPSSYWVAVLKADKRPTDLNLAEVDFLWVKCHGKITIKVIKEQYAKNATDADEIFLRLDTSLLEDGKTMAQLNLHGDNLVALEAIKKADLGFRTRQSSREPLQPTTNHFSPNIAASSRPSFNQSSSVLSSGDENLPPFKAPSAEDDKSRVQRLVTDNHVTQERGTPSQLPTTSHPERTPRTRTFQDLRNQCGFQDFVNYNVVYSPSARISGVNGLIDQCSAAWSILREPLKEPYRVKASLFLQGQEPNAHFDYDKVLQDFIEETAGFYCWFSCEKAYYDRQYAQNVANKTHAFETMVNRWKSSPGPMRAAWSKDAARRIPELSAPAGVFPKLPNSEPSPTPHNSRSVSREASAALETAQTQHFQLQKLFDNSSPELLESAVEKGVEILEGLKKTLTSIRDDADAAQWLQSISNVQTLAAKTKTTIGVVGNTGSGKSSVINAILDEDRLLPTNTMRACTAVVTEISYNHGEVAYRAEIEFITAQEWEKELNTLFQDLIEDGSISKEVYNADSEAGVAYAKIRAVYPKLTKDELVKSSVAKLMDYGNIRKILGGKQNINTEDSLLFYKKLQQFVDSKEKTEKKDKDKNAPREMEFWPLIKIVRIYVKHRSLSTGAVIVDLPGVHDSNAARSAVAQNYLKECSGLWIVSPIIRSVDDKVAKTLLGDTFKRQLKMDGGFSTVTFICSKTDDISLMEAQESLGLEDVMSELWQKSDENTDKKRLLKKEIEELKSTKELYAEATDEAEEQLEIWEKLEEQMEDGKTVYAPQVGTGTRSPSKKRKRGDPQKANRKKQRRNDSEDESEYREQTSDEDEVGQVDEDLDEPESKSQDQGEPLTSDAITAKIAELKDVKKDGRRQRLDVEAKLKDIRKRISEIDAAETKIQDEMNALCIAGRNSYSRQAIKDDYAAGIKELDQELAEEADSANFDPSVEVRDYDEVAKSLPVFCVSSRAYQKLQGRRKKDAPVPGFKTLLETELPQLQDHCLKLTVAGRETTCRRFLNSLSQLLNSLRLWSSNDGTGARLSEGQKKHENMILQNRLRKLDTGDKFCKERTLRDLYTKDFEKHIKGVCQQVREEIVNNISDTFDASISTAQSQADQIALQWGARVNRENRSAGGLYYSTYKAVIRRDGVFPTGSGGPHDWNAQLIEPVIKGVATGWEKTFARRVPHILTTFATKSSQALKAFHSDVEKRATRNGTASLQMLSYQLDNYGALFRDLSGATALQVLTQSRDVNRAFEPVIKQALGPAYTAAGADSGPGVYARMKGVVQGHIHDVRHTMFTDSTRTVEQALDAMVKAAEETMLAKMDGVFLSVKRDYSSAIVGSSSVTGQALPREQRIVRKEVLDIVEGTERVFKQVAGVAFEEEEEEQDGMDTAALRDEAVIRPTREGSDSGNEDASTGLKDEDEELDGTTAAAAEPRENDDLGGLFVASDAEDSDDNQSIQFGGVAGSPSSPEDEVSGHTDEDSESERDYCEGSEDSEDSKGTVETMET